MTWQPISTAPEGREIWTRLYDGQYGERNVQKLVRQGKLWWTPDMTMYVYYQPTEWMDK